MLKMKTAAGLQAGAGAAPRLGKKLNSGIRGIDIQISTEFMEFI